MADPNIQTLIYPISIGGGSVKTYQTDVNKKTGSSVTYDITGLGQKDAILKSEREVDANGKTFYRTNPIRTTYYDSLSSDEKRFIVTDVAYQADNQRAAYVTKNFTQDQINNLFQGMPKVQNTAPKSQFVTSGGTTAPAPEPPPTDPKSIPSLPINSEIASNEIRRNYGADKDLAYPLNRSDEQDYIKFTMFKYDGRELGGEQGITKDNIATFKPGPRRLKKLDGSVTLPIQPSITDSNGVEWGGANLSGPDAYLASLALGGMNSREGLTGMLSDLMGRVQQDLKEIAGTKDFQNAIKLYLAQEAVGVQGLLSRATGAIINPNLELLFNGPTLRPFNFTFRLSPRSENEANNVKRIIRFFKEGMSVQTAASNIFLKAPNLFDISYVGKSSSSLNKIKTCALLGCDVDYTPDGSYMTFNDGTMTSYQLTLRFSEVDPIYSEDYSGLSETEIGY